MNRLRPLLPNLISPLQTAFVPERRGLDNVVIAQELIHSIGLKKGKEGCTTIKIDLEKAYDGLEWSFIRDTLLLFNFIENLIKLIMNCVSTTSISLIFNGGALDPFQPLRGIRQGDLLSPYLFILCMEVLSYLIVDKCNMNLWSPVKASKDGSTFFHLFFTDDLILSVKADIKNCQSLREVLDEFNMLSGQKVSLTKSKVFSSPNVPKALRLFLCEVLGFHFTPNLGIYLGFPLKHMGSTNQDYNFIIERVQSKLAGWKANLLSFTGRVVLTQASISAIPTYIM